MSVRFSDRLFAALQYPLPQHWLSRAMHFLTRIERPGLKNAAIRRFVAHFDVDLSEAEAGHAEDYRSFNRFFTRALKPGVRPLPDTPDAVACPVDGSVSQAGRIEAGRIFQAKGRSFDLVELLGGDATRAKPFYNGCFTTLYLSPRDYHRIHMPLAGQLRETLYVPGRLFSVNPATTRAVPRLFARNERVVALFDTPAGPMAMVLVGALFVASIETVWMGEITPPHRRHIAAWPAMEPVELERGEEMGRFNMGSTVILLHGPDAVNWDTALTPGAAVRMGQTIGRTHALKA